MTAAPKLACALPSQWPLVAADIRKALCRRGDPDHHIAELLENIAPIFRAVEQARKRVEDDVIWGRWPQWLRIVPAAGQSWSEPMRRGAPNGFKMGAAKRYRGRQPWWP